MKLILTEQQYNNLNKNLFEEKQINKILRIKDLAEILSKPFGDDAKYYFETFLEVLNDEYYKNGDDGVIKLFTNNENGFKIEPIGYGRFYVI
jgi:hypothetical protein